MSSPRLEVILWQLWWGHQLCESCCGDEGCAGGRSAQLKRAGSWTAGGSELQLILSPTFLSLCAAVPELALARHLSASAWMVAGRDVLSLPSPSHPSLVEQYRQWRDFPLLRSCHTKIRSLSPFPHPCSPRRFFLSELCREPHHLQSIVPALQDGFPQCDLSLLQALGP